MQILDIGCGNVKTKGAVGLDINPSSGADVIHDLNKFPYPFKDDTFDRIICSNVLEHIDNVPGAMDEIWRISKNGAQIEIEAPFPSSRWLFTDPTHKRAFVSRSFEFWVEGSPYFGRLGGKARFKRVKVEYRKDAGGMCDRFLLKLANRFKEHYESYFMYIYLVHAIYFELRTVK